MIPLNQFLDDAREPIHLVNRRGRFIGPTADLSALRAFSAIHRMPPSVPSALTHYHAHPFTQ
jgi:hypothetical protein